MRRVPRLCRQLRRRAACHGTLTGGSAELVPSAGPVRICLGHALLAGGRAREGLCELERACQSPLITGAERAEAQAWASFARMVLADLDGAAAAAAQARPATAAARDHVATSIAMATLWTAPGIPEAVKPGRMQGHGGTAEVSGGAA